MGIWKDLLDVPWGEELGKHSLPIALQEAGELPGVELGAVQNSRANGGSGHEAPCTVAGLVSVERVECRS